MHSRSPSSVAQPSDEAADDAATPYLRQLLERSPTREILLMRWRPGAVSAAHDHGEAAGVIHVVAGGVEERTLQPTAGGFVVTAMRTALAPAILAVEPGVIHDMRAIGEAVTLHVYDPPVAGMRVYDTERLAVFTVDDDAGAWLPVESGHVLRHEAWPVMP